MSIIRTGALLPTLLVLAAACGGADDVEPIPGDPAPSPTPDQPATIQISPMTGPVGTDVTVEAAGLSPGSEVRIGLGLPNSEFDVITTTTASSDGRARATVSVPDWVDVGENYVFVADGPEERAVSSRFTVTSRDGSETIRLEGVLTDEGVECPALRTNDGALYTLAGDIARFQEGDRVVVEGTVAEMSTCMQGTTINVARITGGG